MTLGRLILVITLVPIFDLWLLVQIGGVVGSLPTIALAAASCVVGAWLVRREGSHALQRFQAAVAKGESPADGILGGLLILLGGILLITPGVLTDMLGMALLISPLRRGVARRVEQRLQTKLQAGLANGQVRVIGFDGRFEAATGASVIDVEAHEVGRSRDGATETLTANGQGTHVT